MSAIRSGIASDFEEPYPERSRLKVGGKSVWVWRHKYQSEDANPTHQLLRDAAIAGQWVKCEGQEREVKNARGSFTQFTAHEVYFQEGDQPRNGDGGGTGGKGKAVGEAPTSDRGKLADAKWAVAAALSAGAPEGFDQMPLEARAEYLLNLAHDLAFPPPPKTAEELLAEAF